MCTNNRVIVSQFIRLTMDDIARLANVSKTTASLVLNGRSAEYRIAEATKERVLAIAREHHFQPSQSAKTLRSRKSGTLGLLVPELSNFAHASLAQALEPLCREAGYQLLVMSSNEQATMEAAGVEHLLTRQVDGLIIVPCSSDATQYLKWSLRLPLIFIDRYIKDCPIPFVVTDAIDAVTSLVVQTIAAGSKEVVYFGGQADLSPSQDRLAGYRKGLELSGVPEQEHWVWQRDYLRPSGYSMMAECHERLGHYPDSLFTGSLTLLEGALAYINEKQNGQPKHLMTFDDHNLLNCMPWGIQSVVQDSQLLASESLSRVLALMKGETVDSIWVPASLHQRA